MTDYWKELGRRAAGCEHWRWLPGMRCEHRWTGGIRVLADETGEQTERYCVLPDANGNAVMTIDECGIMGGFPEAGSAYPFVPDLRDPATLGCLMALVKAQNLGHVVWAAPDCDPDPLDDTEYTLAVPEGWSVVRAGTEDFLEALGRGSTEVEAWVTALERAG